MDIDRYRDIQRDIERDRERYREIERDREKYREIQRDRERQREIEIDRYRQRQIEIARDRQRQIEIDRDRQREIYIQRERLMIHRLYLCGLAKLISLVPRDYICSTNIILYVQHKSRIATPLQIEKILLRTMSFRYIFILPNLKYCFSKFQIFMSVLYTGRVLT